MFQRAAKLLSAKQRSVEELRERLLAGRGANETIVNEVIARLRGKTAKIPGAHVKVGGVTMDFRYSDYFGAEPSTGYERLLYDCMIGDATLFQRADMVEAGWSVVDPILDVWKALPPRNFPNYPSGSWGPREADELLERDGRHWRNFDR